jgi:hypothetical protein
MAGFGFNGFEVPGSTTSEIIYFHGSEGKCKVVPVLNQAPRHEDVLGSGGTAPRILNLGSRWM